MDFAMGSSCGSSSSETSIEEERNIEESIEQNANEKERRADIIDVLVPEESTILEYEIPSIGKEFASDEEAYNFYNSYARKVGFSIRKGRSAKTKKGIVWRRIFECSKEGHRKVDKRTLNLRKSRPDTRTDCKARMVVKPTKDGMWSITEIAYEHNHPLVTEKEVFLLRSQRIVKPIQGTKISSLDNSGVSPTEGYDFLCEEAGGHETLGFTKVDYKNHLRSKRMMKLKDEDIQAVLEYLENKHLEDPMFFHSVQVDKEDKMTNFFWVDARSIQDYFFFGDVVCFDVTYKTNKYGRPFAPFVGVNHHGQTVFFGAALLLDETTESFIWLFQTFLKAMSGQAPKTILTDQAAAIGKAVDTVMPETCHRLCLWHIYLNAAKNLSASYTNKFKKRFKSVIYSPETEEEFFSSWEELLKEFNLEGNKWLGDLFAIREKWALVYGRESFCANMTTTQRSESTNAYLKKYLKRKFNISWFLKHYEKAIERRRLNELSEDFRSNQSFPTLWGNVAILKEVAKEYTLTIYAMFEEEYKMWIACHCDIFEEVGSTCVYKVTEESKKCERLVTFESSNNTVTCSCKKFEFMGIQCRHVIKVLNERKIYRLPPIYILKTWTKSAKFGIVNDNDGCAIQGKAISGSRYSELCHQSVSLATQAANSEKATLFMKEWLRTGQEKIEEILKEEAGLKPNTSILVDGDPMSQPIRGIQAKEDSGPSGRIVSIVEKKRKKRSQSSNNTKSKKGNPGKNNQNVEGTKQASTQAQSQLNLMPCPLTCTGPIQFQHSFPPLGSHHTHFQQTSKEMLNLPLSDTQVLPMVSSNNIQVSNDSSFLSQLLSYRSPLHNGVGFQLPQVALLEEIMQRMYVKVSCYLVNGGSHLIQFLGLDAI